MMYRTHREKNSLIGLFMTNNQQTIMHNATANKLAGILVDDFHDKGNATILAMSSATVEISFGQICGAKMFEIAIDALGVGAAVTERNLGLQKLQGSCHWFWGISFLRRVDCFQSKGPAQQSYF